MLKETELRIVKALTTTSTPSWHIAREWNITERTLMRIQKKYGVKRAPTNWYELARGRKRGA